MQPSGPPTGRTGDIEHLHVGVTRPAPDAIRILAVGALDMPSSSIFSDTVTDVLASGCRYTIIDLSTVTFLGSAGLGTIARAVKTADQHHIGLRLVADTRVVLRPLEVTGLAQTVKVTRSVEEALADLAQEG